MEEQLNEILSNEELDNEAKQKAITKLVGSNFVDRDKYNEVKESTTTQQEAYNTLKAELDTLKESKMTEEEKVKARELAKDNEIKAIREQLNEATARSMFADAEIDKEVYEELLPSVVKEDTELTKATVTSVCNSLKKQREAIEKKFTDKLIKNTPTPPAGNDNDKQKPEEGEIEKYKKLLKEARKNGNYTDMGYYTRLIQETEAKANKK